MRTPLKELQEAAYNRTPMFKNTHLLTVVKPVDEQASLTAIFFPIHKDYPLENLVAHLHVKTNDYGSPSAVYIVKIDLNEVSDKNRGYTFTAHVSFDEILKYFIEAEFVINDTVKLI
ncbi:hypothetical protein [Fibrisoma montanum]|nr:hypothetical protein [Fibrisoma montanum]